MIKKFGTGYRFTQFGLTNAKVPSVANAIPERWMGERTNDFLGTGIAGTIVMTHNCAHGYEYFDGVLEADGTLWLQSGRHV